MGKIVRNRPKHYKKKFVTVIVQQVQVTKNLSEENIVELNDFLSKKTIVERQIEILSILIWVKTKGSKDFANLKSLIRSLLNKIKKLQSWSTRHELVRKNLSEGLKLLSEISLLPPPSSDATINSRKIEFYSNELQRILTLSRGPSKSFISLLRTNIHKGDVRKITQDVATQILEKYWRSAGLKFDESFLNRAVDQFENALKNRNK